MGRACYSAGNTVLHNLAALKAADGVIGLHCPAQETGLMIFQGVVEMKVLPGSR